MRVLRWLLGTLFGLVLLVLAVAAALWLWSGTEGSARFVLEQVARRQPLVVEGVRGDLRHGLQADRVAWQQDGLAAEARQVELAWQPLALLQGVLRLDRLTAAVVRIEDRRPPSGTRPQPPASVALPIQVAIGELALGRLEWAGPPEVALLEVSAGYSWDGTEHHLALRNLRVFDGHYRGDVRLGAGEGLPLLASLQGRIVAPVPGGKAPLPLVFDATASGPLAGFDAQLRVQGEPGSAAAAGTRLVANARVTPFAELPVATAQAELQGLDAGALWPQAPTTSLSGRVSVRPQGTETWVISADLRNALPGPWDKRRAPVERLRLEGDWRSPGTVLVRELDARVGGGRLQARGQWQGEAAWQVDGTLTGVHPAALHGMLSALPLSGRATVRANGPAITFDTTLEAPDAAPPATNGLAAAAGPLEVRSLAAKGRWAGGELSLQTLVARTADARLDAALDLRPSRRSGRGRIDLEAPGMRVRGVGSLAPGSGGGTMRLSATAIGQAQRWLQKLPGLPPAIGALALDGRAEVQLGWQGGWDDPTVQATATVPLLTAPGAPGQPAAWAVRDLQAKVDGRLADARLELRAKAQQATREATVELAGRGGRRGADAWQGEVASLQLAASDSALGKGVWRLVLRRPVALRWAASQLDLDAGEAGLVAPAAPGTPPEASLAWDPLRWRAGQLRTAGRLSGVPLAWLQLFAGAQLAGTTLGGDMVVDAQWDAQLADTLRLRASVVRARGDLSVLAETADGHPARVQAGVREARLTLDSEGDAVTLALRWDSERAGSADARLVTRLARSDNAWTWPQDAPLSGTVHAQLPRLGVWSLLAPPGWRLRGSLAADISVAGTRGEPALSGSLRADDVALRSVVDGVALQDGRLRARLEAHRLVVDELVLRGAGDDGGTLSGSGEANWSGGSPQVAVTARLERLRASSRGDRELTLSGTIAAGVDAEAAQVRGDLRIDRARITLPDEATPRLGQDVAVRNLPPGVALGPQRRTPEAAAEGGARKLTLAVNLDFGDDFRVTGKGISTRLAGALVVSGASLAEPQMVGQVRTVGGEYQAYGQRLDIERGVLRFTGPADNPALDVLAIRPHLIQKVGVQVTGTAQLPFVRLYADPDLPEAEKLAWLVLGRPAASGGAEAAVLQSAALALLERRAGGGTGRGPAQLLGLDEVGIRRDAAEGPAVTLGKRIGRNLYASYERSLSTALGSLYLYYELSRRVQVRAEAGERGALDLIFTFQYD
ncbi:translocation/assembly module TamB domain-containing protein [Ramlibacter sp. CGMCC 1.13660]|uniref:translocation/assembly module TamB domain-containing protein n=1 Tax=Ramlibacter sp. CGMCC 1.13660 TaxID=2755558 RepID=UPI0012FB06D1|nr:translocation/assembly module TamB domain-containing protein [Ramlibacter sp. CGMCC 1.13660]